MKKTTRQITNICLIILTCFIYLILTLQIVNSQRIAFGVKLADFNLGGHKFSVAQEILKNKLQDSVEKEIIFTCEKEMPDLSARLDNLGLQIDKLATINYAYQIGRKKNSFINIKEQLAALIGSYDLELIYTTDQNKFQEKTNELFKDIERPAQNASLVFDEQISDFVLQHSNEGIVINREKLLFDLIEQIKSLSDQPINLELVFDEPIVKNNEVDLVKQKAQKILLNQPYQLILETKTWNIDKNRLINWIEFKPVQENETDNQILGFFLNNDQVEKYLKEITSTINQYPINAHLETEGNRAIAFTPNQEGYGIDIDKTVNQLIQNITAESPIKKTIITAQKLLPKITLEQTNKLGINTLLGQGTSNFYGSPKNRVHNIKTGVAKFNGIILNPGEEFSFNTLLGGSGPEQGFLPELVIKKNKTVPEYGGGLCQVSTTFFRVAINSGLKITERSAHAFPVQYYNPQGFDATIYEPHPDFRFVNNTPNHLLIETTVQGYQLIFNFYGTNDGREIKIKGPYILESNEDGSMKAVLTQEIYQKDELIDKDVFYSNYKSPDLYPVGTVEEETENGADGGS
ncbi:MAG: VanW family protein [Parcubacteria group bacterium]|nr:VanW family protein [Parcubacteria group bacterium]